MTIKSSQINYSDDFIERLRELSANGCGVPIELIKDSKDSSFDKLSKILYMGLEKLKDKMVIQLHERNNRTMVHFQRESVNSNMFESDSQDHRRQNISFPCPNNGEIVTCADCFDCHRYKYCDIYASMLNEDNN